MMRIAEELRPERNHLGKGPAFVILQLSQSIGFQMMSEVRREALSCGGEVVLGLHEVDERQSDDLGIAQHAAQEVVPDRLLLPTAQVRDMGNDLKHLEPLPEKIQRGTQVPGQILAGPLVAN